MELARQGIGAAAVIALGMLLGASAYESVVMAPNYSARVPESLEHARSFFAVVTPASYFRVLSPVTQILLVLSTALAWREPKARWWFVGALVALAAADVITFTYHYPRNEMMFQKPLSETPPQALADAAREWGPANHLRIALMAVAVAAALLGLTRLARRSAPETRPAGA